MLPNHSPLIIAEQFGTLEALFPGRIDLGLGRAALRTLLICLVIPAVVMDSYGRGLHDRAVGSIVLRADSVR